MMVLIPRPPLAGDLMQARPKLLQCQEDAARFATTPEQRRTHEINVILNATDAEIGAVLSLRRIFGPSTEDAETLAGLVRDAAAAIERAVARR